MAIRIRKDGRILCAAMHPAEPGDTYIDDTWHHLLAAEAKLIASERMEQHQNSGQWWWVGNIPEGVEIDPFYLEKP